MPRLARLDVPGLLQHVIVRGIERRDIFLGDDDRSFFVQRLSSLLVETDTNCLAWALMSNHFHLLVAPRKVRLATFMRRLLTSYAVRFNLRHNRHGHLFQNRYKSIVCDEDEYLLELVRYIHLNPLRAGLVDSDSLDHFPWSGHSVLMGNGTMQGQDADNVLSLFGKRVGEARRRYRAFVQDGVAQGKRNDLVGSPTRGVEQGATGISDIRILGDSDFVEELRCKEPLGRLIEPKIELAEIIERVAEHFGIVGRALSTASRSPVVVQCRAIVCHMGFLTDHPAAEICRHLGMSRYGVCVAGARGKALTEESADFAGLMRTLKKQLLKEAKLTN